MTATSSVEMTWLGHGTWRVKTPGGKHVLIDPWVAQNPACPDSLKKPTQIDVMLITHGHYDHIGDAVQLAKEHQPQVGCIFETGIWLESKGVQKVATMNKGGTQTLGDIKVTMVHADHSCGILDDGKIIYGGDPCGYVIELENGYKIYHAGDTNVFGDMRIIGELYQPDLCMLPIGDLYTMSPREAAYACKLLTHGGAIKVVGMHYGTFPPLTGRPETLRELTANLDDVEILQLEPGGCLQA